MAFACPADICVFGGGAGGGKTWYELMDPARWAVSVPGFRAVIFRRTYPEITNPGGLWDESEELYPQLGGTSNRSDCSWEWPNGSWIKFSHLQHETDKKKWQGAQLAFVGFDEATHFSQTQVFYLISRLRSTCGVKPYMRLTCNPDPDSWVAKFISWWINPETGFPIPERAGVLRWMAREGDTVIWADTREELEAQGYEDPMSVTFIPSLVDNNLKLLAKDPTYKSKLKSLSLVERERLLKGNWKIKAAPGLVFKRHWFPIIDAIPQARVKRVVRYWDRAATDEADCVRQSLDADYTAGAKLIELHSPQQYLLVDMRRERLSPMKVEMLLRTTASQDKCEVVLEEDPGQAGKVEIDHLVRALNGFHVTTNRVTTDKLTRALPVSSQAEQGNILLLRGAWNDAFLDEAESFDGLGVAHDDQVDALSGAYNHFQNDQPQVW